MRGVEVTPQLLGESRSAPSLWPATLRSGCGLEMSRTPFLFPKKVVLQFKKPELRSLCSMRGGKNVTVYFKLPLLHRSGLVWHVRSKVLDLSHYSKETMLKGAFLHTYFLSSSFTELDRFWSLTSQGIMMVTLLTNQQVPQCGFGHCLPYHKVHQKQDVHCIALSWRNANWGQPCIS